MHKYRRLEETHRYCDNRMKWQKITKKFENISKTLNMIPKIKIRDTRQIKDESQIILN